MSDEKKTTATIVLDGQSVEIKKLRAGKFYDAQKVIGGLLKKAATLIPSKDVVEGKKPDIKDLDILGLVSLFDDVPHEVAKFVAICAEWTEQDLLAKAYPEEITTAFSVCIELNDVMKNLKNSVAPMGKLGAIKDKEE